MASPRVLIRGIALGSALCLVAGSLVFLGTTGSSAAPTTYYVDSTAACPGSGTLASPWCGFQCRQLHDLSTGRPNPSQEWGHLHVENGAPWVGNLHELFDGRHLWLGRVANHQRQ